MKSKSVTKKKHGGKRPGAGRKPMLIEDNVKGAIQKVLAMDPESLARVWAKVLEKAERGSDRHIQILFNYYYGKPIETVEVTSKQLNVTRVIVHE